MTHMVDTVMINAYIRHMGVNRMVEKELSYLEFIMLMCDELNVPASCPLFTVPEQ